MHRDSKMLLCPAPIAGSGCCDTGCRSEQMLRIHAKRAIRHHILRLREKRCRLGPAARDRQTFQNEREAASPANHRNPSGDRQVLPCNRRHQVSLGICLFDQGEKKRGTPLPGLVAFRLAFISYAKLPHGVIQPSPVVSDRP